MMDQQRPSVAPHLALLRDQKSSPYRLSVHTYFPFVELTGGGTVVEDGTGEASFTATRTGLDPNDPAHQPILNEALTVDLEDRSYEVLAPEVKATWGVDFQLAKTITIPSGGVSQTEYVTPVDDPDAEGLETIALAAARSGDYFAAAPGERPATTRAAQNDDIKVRSVKLSLFVPPPPLPAPVNAFHGYDFYVSIAVEGERLDQVLYDMDVRSLTQILDFTNNFLGDNAINEYLQQLHNDPAVPFNPNLVNTGPEYREDYHRAALINLDAKKGKSRNTDRQSFGVLPIAIPGSQEFYCYLVAQVKRDFKMRFYRADNEQQLATKEWGTEWNNAACAWEQGDQPVPPEQISAVSYKNGGNGTIQVGGMDQ